MKMEYLVDVARKQAINKGTSQQRQRKSNKPTKVKNSNVKSGRKRK